mgnify:CR=1 FL=1
MDYAKMIDHTLLKTDAQKKDLDKLLLEAKKYNFMSVCVSPIWVKYAAEQLKRYKCKSLYKLLVFHKVLHQQR